MHLGCCSTFGKRKNTLACGSSIFTLSESLATFFVHGSRNHARETMRYSFNTASTTRENHYLRRRSNNSMRGRARLYTKYCTLALDVAFEVLNQEYL
jgi:hypothetical protein